MRLENTSYLDQSAWDENDAGRRYTIAAGETISVPEKVAALFFEQCSGEVVEFQDAVIPLDPGSAEVWVANNTGNPNFPETFTFEHFDRQDKRSKLLTEPHPLKDAHTIRHEWDPGQADMTIDGKLYRNANLQKIMVKLPPYCRRKMPMPVAHAWMACLNFGPSERVSSLVMSRPAAPHEPNDTWKLDNILAFGEEVQPKFMQIHELKSTPQLPKVEGKPDPIEYERTKKEALRAWFYLSINPAVRLPSEAAWKAKRGELSADSLIQEKVRLESENRKLQGKKSG